VVHKYEQRGVSADKSEVHQAIRNLDKGLYPNAFCKILPDFAANNPAFCNLMHADTAGTKTSLAYLYWRETGDLSVWAGIVQDAIVMNLDDMGCVGCTDGFVLSSTIGRNKGLVTGAVLTALIEGTRLFAERMTEMGVTIHLAGGETADVGDIVRTADVGFTAFARMPRNQVIECNIKTGAWIVGVSSEGQAVYEDSYNSGIGSNGLTSARHDLFSSIYRQRYPESFDPAMPQDLSYAGSRLVTEDIEVNGQVYPLGKLMLSPTRTFLPLLQRFLADWQPTVQGIIHNTGGGLSKVVKFLPDGVMAVKENLLPVPPLFDWIANESQAPATELYKVFNMGCRLEFYLDTEEAALAAIDHAAKLGLHAQIMGRTIAVDGMASVQARTREGETIVYG
jgi:phosphoribosylformylglycinamidine cyclo-ligase